MFHLTSWSHIYTSGLVAADFFLYLLVIHAFHSLCFTVSMLSDYLCLFRIFAALSPLGLVAVFP